MRASRRLRKAYAALVGSLFLSAAGIVPAPAAADLIVPGEEHCVVNIRTDDALNRRTWPSSNAPVEAGKRYGECGILVLEPCLGNWCKVEDGHSLGWASRRFLAMVSPAMYCVTGVAPGDMLNLRAYPSPRSQVLTRLDRRRCNISFLPYAAGNWQKIRVAGWQGWVNRRYLSGE